MDKLKAGLIGFFLALCLMFPLVYTHLSIKPLWTIKVKKVIKDDDPDICNVCPVRTQVVEVYSPCGSVVATGGSGSGGGGGGWDVNSPYGHVTSR